MTKPKPDPHTNRRTLPAIAAEVETMDINTCYNEPSSYVNALSGHVNQLSSHVNA